MCKAEAEVRPGPNSLDKHGVEFGGPTGYIDGKMRAIAVSWLVEVTSEFDMHQETLFLAVNLLDRFLSVTKVKAHDLSTLHSSYPQPATLAITQRASMQIGPVPFYRPRYFKVGERQSLQQHSNCSPCLLVSSWIARSTAFSLI